MLSMKCFYDFNCSVVGGAFVAFLHFGKIILLLIITLFFAACGGDSDNKENSKSFYSVELSVFPANSGSLFGGGFYSEGETITISASPNDGFSFVNWTDHQGNVVYDSQKVTLNLHEDYRLQANFEVSIQAVKVPLPSKGIFRNIYVTKVGNDVLFATTREKTIGDGFEGLWRSADGGKSWKMVLRESVNFVEAAYMGEKLIVAGKGPDFYISDDSGQSWTLGAISSPASGDVLSVKKAQVISKDKGVFVLVSRSGLDDGIYKSLDLGRSWNRVVSSSYLSPVNNSTITDFLVFPDNPDVMYMTGSSFPQIWKTSDGGLTNVSIVNGFSNSVTAGFGEIQVNPENAEEVFISKNISVNGGANWVQINNIYSENSFWLDGDLINIGSPYPNNGGNWERPIKVSQDYGNTWLKVMDFTYSSLGSLRSLSISDDAIYIQLFAPRPRVDRVYKLSRGSIASKTID